MATSKVPIGKAPAKKAATRTVTKLAAKKAVNAAAPAKTAAPTQKAAPRPGVRKAIDQSTVKKVAAAKKAAPEASVRKAVKQSKVRKAPPEKPAPKPAPKPATTTAAAGKVTARKVASQSAVATSAGKQAAARKPAAQNNGAKPSAATRKRGITPKQALANTLALLEAKQEHDRQPLPWQQFAAPHAHHPATPDSQSPEAAQKAVELHAGESRMQAIQGSISTTDRRNQSKRDHR